MNVKKYLNSSNLVDNCSVGWFDFAVTFHSSLEIWHSFIGIIMEIIWNRMVIQYNL